MKLSTTIIFFVAMASVFGQSKMAPRPTVIIICKTNQSAPITIVSTSANGWSENYVKQQSVITNLQISCGTAKSVTAKREKDHVLLIVREATMYQPTVIEGKYGKDQRLQTVIVDEWSVDLLNTQLVQVNDEILSAERFAQKFKTIPSGKN